MLPSSAVSEAGGERHMDETQDDERATALIAIWYKKDEEIFGRRSQIDRALQEAFSCCRGRWTDALPRCVGYPFACAGKVNEAAAAAAACIARFRKIISAAARSLAHREEERTREHEKTRHLTSQSDPTDTNRRARRETASPSDGAAEAARTMT